MIDTSLCVCTALHDRLHHFGNLSIIPEESRVNLCLHFVSHYQSIYVILNIDI